MSARGFGSVIMVASCAGAALGCYLVSLRVASERAALEQVETEIVLAQRDIRLLQTEIGTRGRLAQLERWNVKVLALSAPSADQFLGGGFELARLVQPKRKIDIEAPVVLAAAPGEAAAKPQVRRAPAADDIPDLSPQALMQTVSLKRELPPQPTLKAKAEPRKAVPAEVAKAPPPAPVAKGKAEAKDTAAPAKPKPAAQAADKKKPAATEKKKSAVADPLAPLKSAPAKPKKIAAASRDSTRTP